MMLGQIRSLLHIPASTLVILGVSIVPFVCSLVTYTFVSLPDNSIALNQNGALVALLVLLKIFILGVTGRIPVNLNEFFAKRRGKRAARLLTEESLEEELSCTIRILCELETAARTAVDDAFPDLENLHEGPVDDRGQTTGDGDRVEGTLLDLDHIGMFQEIAVEALFLNETSSKRPEMTQNDLLATAEEDDLKPGSLLALSHLDRLTGGGRCEVAYARCPGRLRPQDALGILFRELGVRMP